mmetsp:Transcript_18610/g.30850  ORF Transcript_18610/g.30850 Transcript_18610/m.30850 type:complete len:206 (-) Transcript_18610:1641-2258(-)
MTTDRSNSIVSTGNQNLARANTSSCRCDAQRRYRLDNRIGLTEHDRLGLARIQAGKGGYLLWTSKGCETCLVNHSLVQGQDSKLGSTRLGVEEGVDDPVLGDQRWHLAVSSGVGVADTVQNATGHSVHNIDKEIWFILTCRRFGRCVARWSGTHWLALGRITLCAQCSNQWVVLVLLGFGHGNDDGNVRIEVFKKDGIISEDVAW